jgi:tetratricopeptide (TPR) repeat protein
MRAKVKLTKQQIKEDKFTNFVLMAKDWFLDNWRIFAITAAIIVLAVVGLVYYFKMRATQSKDMENRFSRAVAEARAKNYQVAILEFKSISEEAGGEIAGMALFQLANAYYESRNYDEAINSYNKYLAEYKGDDITTASATAGVAVCLECKGEFSAAGDKFYEAAQKYPSAADYYVGAIRNYVQASDKPKVDKLLAEIKEKFPQTDHYRAAARLAMQLKTE